MTWPVNRDKFGPDRIPVLTGLADDGSGDTAPIAVDPTTGNLQMDAVNSGLVPVAYDSLTYTSASTTDTYNYYQGGVSGLLVATVSITYTGTDKGTISKVVRT